MKKEVEMKVDLSKIEKIGIDRIVLSELKILNFDDLKRDTKRTKNNEIFEKVEYTEYGLFSMSYTRNCNEEGKETYHFSSLELNPSKLKYGHNIYNANLTELKESLDIVLEKLKDVGINLDISEAKIKEIEIDKTLVSNFEELQEVVLLIDRANYKKAFMMSSCKKEDTPQKIRRERTLYLNSKMPESKKGNLGKIIKLYNKSFEMRLRHKIELDKNLTRVEVLFGQDYFRSIMKRIGLDNSLKTFISNDVLEDIFIKSLTNELLTKPTKYLEKIKKNLNYEFNNFRRNERVKREYRKRYIKQGKEVPKEYKEERGVFKYLKDNSWIFDFSFLIEVINRNIISRRRQNFEKQISKSYTHIANLSLYNFLTKKVFGEIFLPH